MEQNDLTEQLHKEINKLPESLLPEVYDFIQFVKSANSDVWSRSFQTQAERDEAVYTAFKQWQIARQ